MATGVTTDVTAATDVTAQRPKKRLSAVPSAVRRYARVLFPLWGAAVTLWLADSYRTRGVEPATLRSGPSVTVSNTAQTLALLPSSTAPDAPRRQALVFVCGSGVAAEAYAPLLRPLAERGHAVFIVRLPLRFAPTEAHRSAVVDRVREVVAGHPGYPGWVLAGHSLGGALACRAVRRAAPDTFSALVLIGTTHPKAADDLSALEVPVTKVSATNDGVAPLGKVRANRGLLPASTRWVEIAGGNHSQFGHYGHQVLDGAATIGRAEQQEITRAALRDSLAAPPPR
jgi:pimeloyl-ACP methyl ester carboxylesterase